MVAVRVDPPIITAQGEGTALDFALGLIEILQDASSAFAAAKFARHPRLDHVITHAPYAVDEAAITTLSNRQGGGGGGGRELSKDLSWVFPPDPRGT